MTQVLITGVYGQLGRALNRAAGERKLSYEGVDLDTLDITDCAAVDRWVDRHRPGTVINCAAFTAVDACETQQQEAIEANGTAVGHLADACNRHGAQLVQISTDYVFDGAADRPYLESDPTRPLGAYGRSKLAGEVEAQKATRHLIVRTAWLYGLGGNNFVEAIRRQVAGKAERLRVVDDQQGCPTFCDDLAEAVLDLVDREVTGTVHAVNSGQTTWHGFAYEIVRLLGSPIPVEPVATEAFPRPAPRPAYSVLDTSKLELALGRMMPTWQNAVSRYLEATCVG